MTELLDALRIGRPNVKDSTLNIYSKNIMKIIFEVFETSEFKIDYLRKFSIIKFYIENTYLNPKTKRNYYNSIIVALMAFKQKNYTIKKYIGEVNKLNIIINNSYNSHEKSETEKKNWLDWEKILEKRDEVRKESEKKPTDVDALQQYLIVCIYTYIAPQRNIWASCVIYTNSDDSNLNYVDLNKKIAVFNDHKTITKYGSRIIQIPDYVIELIKKLLKLRASKYLLTNKNNEILGCNSMTGRLNRIFAPNKISSSMLRKAYISYHLKYDEELEKKRLKMASDMGHSAGIGKMIYTKK